MKEKELGSNMMEDTKDIKDTKDIIEKIKKRRAESLAKARGKADGGNASGDSNRESSRFDAFEVAVDTFGMDAANYARILSDKGFADFKAGMIAIGFPALSDADVGGIGRQETPLYAEKAPRLANAALCMRYPFLVPRSRWSDKVIWYESIDDAMWNEEHDSVPRNEAFATTELDALPIGWLARFGLEICEDIKVVLESSVTSPDSVGEYRIQQIKEKFGTLRWYSALVPEDVYEDELHVIDLYELISARTCINCGGHDRIRVSGGWISYECARCRERRIGGVSDEQVIGHYNEMVADGSIVRLVSGQSDAWKTAYGFDDERATSLGPVERRWEIPHAISSLVVKDILDASSAAVGPIEGSRIQVTYQFGAGLEKPVESQFDLLGWGEERGLLCAPLARSIDRIRHDLDGTTNLPRHGDEEGE